MQGKDKVNPGNKYNHNFSGVYCTCNRPYPDSEDEVSGDVGLWKCVHVREWSLFSMQVEDDMIQCCICEDWFHSRVRVKNMARSNFVDDGSSYIISNPQTPTHSTWVVMSPIHTKRCHVTLA